MGASWSKMAVRGMRMDWVKTAKGIFDVPKPDHFTNFRHCDECAEHDRTLLSADVDTIGLDQLGNPGWDPICFASPEGKQYYLPALIRLSLETMTGDFYLETLLFHLAGNGTDNAFYLRCNAEQRNFIASFIAYVIEAYSGPIEDNFCTDNALNSYAIRSGCGTKITGEFREI